MNTNKSILLILVLLLFWTSCSQKENNTLYLSEASIIISTDIEKQFKTTLQQVIQEEFELRSGVKPEVSGDWGKTNIALVLSGTGELKGKKIPQNASGKKAEQKDEGYRLFHEESKEGDILWIIGNDQRALLFGIGQLLRIAKFQNGKIGLPKGTDISTAPEFPIRGHQFGYRNTANSWDAWSVEQFDQHFREQVLFGANCFENIPFQDGAPSVHMKVPREEMNIHLSRICQKYDADYWIWTPATFNLKDTKQRKAELEKHENFYKQCPRLDAVFFPGGDPGHNHPEDVIPFLEELTGILHKYHPEAGMWISLQGFNREKAMYFFEYVQQNNPAWLKGVVNGPSSPPLEKERELLPAQYMIRSYPDITHTVRCQYPTKNWDQAFALTLGRECTNPQPNYYADIHNQYAKYTDGFLSYSDGVHDDVNKAVWSQRGWDSNKEVTNIIHEYCNFYFGSEMANKAAQGIFALEKNWDGPVRENTQIKNTLELWMQLEKEYPDLQNNWRWQQLLMRAYYDAFIQEREAYEKKLEKEANLILADAKELGAHKAMEKALKHVQLADSIFVAEDLKEKAVFYINELYKSIGLQTSVELHNARGYERGCVLDFIDYPLNNRWWLEDEFNKISKMDSEAQKLERLDFICNYENPGKESFYDNISSADAKHVVSETDDAIDYLWENNGFSRKRLSTQLFQFSPVLEYNELDSQVNYLIRVSGYGEALLRANGERLTSTKYEKGFEQFKEFPLPKSLIKDGKLKITFDKPDEDHLNWRQQSRVTDVWLLKQ